MVQLSKLAISITLATSLIAATPAYSAFADQFTTGETVSIEIFATVPDRSDGATARLNAVTYSGERLFAVESYDGLIYEITGGVSKVWFNVASAIGNDFDNSDRVEGGLRSVAFHPEFQQNGKFYTSQDQRRPLNTQGVTYLSDVTNPQPTDSVVTEWTMTGNGRATSRELLRIGQPGVHSIKQMAFNNHAAAASSDYGLLYIAHGDGSSVESDFGSHRNSALGKILRIDPQASAQKAYTIPLNNPFQNDSSVPDEVFALGLRNPHNLSFSRSGLLFVADIGSGNVEEINLVTVGSNYGWGEREGRHTYIDTTRGTGVTSLPANDASFGYTYPAASFRLDVNHDGGLAVAGGYAIENGSSLQGRYIFGEFGSTGEFLYAQISEMQRATTTGNPRSLSEATVFRSDILFDHDNNPLTNSVRRISMLDVINDSPDYNAASNRADLRFGQGPDGEVYITSKQNNTVYLVSSTVTPVAVTNTACIDEDGDGWGWNGVSSCQVDTEEQTESNTGTNSDENNSDEASPVISQLECIDTDGDGWGWDGVMSCRVNQSQPTEEQPSESVACIDSDGDGWGWNGTETCRINNTINNTTVESSSICVDSDGDGWGWNGESSCRVEN